MNVIFDFQMAFSSETVSVAVRVRPTEPGNNAKEWLVQAGVIYATRAAHNVFAFDQVFPSEASNADVYEKAVQPMISSVVAGSDVVIFAYGATSSGKSHTMMGNNLDSGIIERSITGILDEIKHVS